MRPRFEGFSVRAVVFALAALAATGCASDSGVAPPGGGSGPNAAKQSTTSGLILFTRLMGFTTRQLFSMNDDGTNVQQVLSLGGGALDAAWAPDSKRVLVAGEVASDARDAIFSVNPDGTGLTTLTTPPEGCADRYPATFRKQIVFMRVCTTSGTIILMNEDGTGLTPLISPLPPRRFSVSPKDAQIAYTNEADIWLLDIATGGVTNITASESLTEVDPSFSPSGKTIAFQRLGGGLNSIATMNSDGTMVTPLIVRAAAVDLGWPVWSPDGKRIAFFGSLDSDVDDVYVMNADGTAITNLTLGLGSQALTQAWAHF